MDRAGRGRDQSCARAVVAPPISEMGEMQIGRRAQFQGDIPGGLGSSKRTLSAMTSSLSALSRSSSEPILLDLNHRNSLVKDFIPLNLVTKGLATGPVRAFSCRELRSDPWWITRTDEKMVAPLTCGIQLIRKCQEELKTIVPKMVLIWEQLGFSDSKKAERFFEARNYHKDLWEAMLEEQQSKFSVNSSNNSVVKTTKSLLFLKDALVQECMDVIQSFVPKMTLMWEQFKLPKSKKELWLLEALRNHEELWETMLKEEQNNKEEIAGRVNKLEMLYRTLCKELGIDHHNFRDTVPLLDREFWLKKQTAVLTQGKEDRMRCLRIQLAQDEQLCKRLGSTGSSMNQDSVPSAEELWTLHDRIKDLKDKIATRQLQYGELKDSIRSTKQELDTAIGRSFDCSEFEEEFFINDLSSVNLSDIQMNKLKSLHEDLKYQLRLKRNEGTSEEKESEKDKQRNEEN